MGYCTENDIKKTIAQALTSATSQTTDGLGTLSDLLNVGNVLDKNLVTSEVINYYIQLADQEIDGILSQLYEPPFCEKVDFESELYSSIDEYNEYIVLERNCPLAVGDVILLKYEGVEERHEIDEVISYNTFSVVSPIQYYFPEGTRLLRITFPPPIRFVSARLASANIYDKYFSAESSANVSNFGEKLRELAYARLADITTGSIILHGQRRIGRRFYNPNLVDQYGLPDGGNLEKNYRRT
jgi:hypothetical protein